jgi:hypothetical protein
MKFRTFPLVLVSLFTFGNFANAGQKTPRVLEYNTVAICDINGQDIHLMVPSWTSCKSNGKALMTLIDRGNLSKPGGMRTFEANFVQAPGKVIRFSSPTAEGSCKEVFSIPIDSWKGDYEVKGVTGTYEQLNRDRQDDSKSRCGITGTLKCSLIAMPGDLCPR